MKINNLKTFLVFFSIFLILISPITLARYYDPYLRRFVKPDPIIQDVYNPQDLNRYVYVRNNPYKYTDPTGMWAVQVGGSGLGGVGFVGSTVGGGLTFSHSPEYGFEIGTYGTGGGGAYYNPLGSRGGIDIMYTHSAKRLQDIAGPSTHMEAGGMIVPGLVVGGSRGSPLVGDIGPTYGVHTGPGIQTPIPVPVYGTGFVTETEVAKIYSSEQGFTPLTKQQKLSSGLETLSKKDSSLFKTKQISSKKKESSYLGRAYSYIRNIFSKDNRKNNGRREQ